MSRPATCTSSQPFSCFEPPQDSQEIDWFSFFGNHYDTRRAKNPSIAVGGNEDGIGKTAVYTFIWEMAKLVPEAYEKGFNRQRTSENKRKHAVVAALVIVQYCQVYVGVETMHLVAIRSLYTSDAADQIVIKCSPSIFLADIMQVSTENSLYFLVKTIQVRWSTSLKTCERLSIAVLRLLAILCCSLRCGAWAVLIFRDFKLFESQWIKVITNGPNRLRVMQVRSVQYFDRQFGLSVVLYFMFITNQGLWYDNVPDTLD